MKLRITIDIFSGLPNPSWMLEDAKQVADLLERLEASPTALTQPHEVPSKLGLRAVHVERLDDQPPAAAQGPGLWVVAPGTAADPAAAAQLAEDLVNTAPAGPLATAGTLQQFPPELQEYVIGEIRQWPTNPGSDQRSSGSGPSLITPPAAGLAQIICAYDTVTFDPAYWNDQAHIQRNNCYNYASNIRNDTFAQPGYKHGYIIPRSCTLTEVAQGARADGYRADGNCQPLTATNRWLVALVAGTFPGGKRDYHWYRRHTEGFWGHKAGQGPAGNTDNSGRVINDPEHCNRGNYTEWGGYYLSSNAVEISGPLAAG